MARQWRAVTQALRVDALPDRLAEVATLMTGEHVAASGIDLRVVEVDLERAASEQDVDD